MKKPLEYLITTLGITAAIPIYIILALSIPLSILAIVHITGWGLWKALIMFGVFSFVPLIQLAVFFAPFLGAYYLIAADFDWEKAAYPNAQVETLDYSKMSDSDYDKYKKEVVVPQTIEDCKQDVVKKVGFEGKITPEQSNFCSCFAEKVVSKIKKEDFAMREKDQNYRPLNDEQVKQAAIECQD